MRAKELIPILSAILEVPLETALVVDRSLADNGMRSKGKGRTPPDMTRRDALNFTLACMTMNVATRAADPAKHWGNCPEQDVTLGIGEQARLPDWFHSRRKGVNLIDRMIDVADSVEAGVFDDISFSLVISTSRGVAEFRYFDGPTTEVRRDHFFYLPGSLTVPDKLLPSPREFAHFATGINRQVDVSRETFLALAHYTEREP